MTLNLIIFDKKLHYYIIYYFLINTCFLLYILIFDSSLVFIEPDIILFIDDQDSLAATPGVYKYDDNIVPFATKSMMKGIDYKYLTDDELHLCLNYRSITDNRPDSVLSTGYFWAHSKSHYDYRRFIEVWQDYPNFAHSSMRKLTFALNCTYSDHGFNFSSAKKDLISTINDKASNYQYYYYNGVRTHIKWWTLVQD